uniref:Rhodanese domain-containing protein n=1 Tax=Fagus sylvatica TaxID=28930 RepID=A0A2N9GKS0_FAGSY
MYTARTWNISFIRDFNDWELPAVISFFTFLQPFLPIRERRDTMRWKLRRSAARGKILTCDNLMRRGYILAGWCCMCKNHWETGDHLLLHCEVATALWNYVFTMFGIQWVLPATVLDMLFGWHNWFGKRSSAVWNLAPLCVMWSLWQERNRRIFEDLEKPFSHLQEQFSGLLFDCSRSWGYPEAPCLPDFVDIASDPLANVDKEKTDILMYCTGGIRCDVYSTILRQQGFQNLYTLKGGVSHYLKNEGPAEWVGNLFVFDSRLSLPPSTYKSKSVLKASRSEQVSENNTFARCYICGSQVSELRHRNCANLDCNLLFLCCADCVEDLKGCCGVNCIAAPRLRPVLPGHQRYKKWHIYRDVDCKAS